VKYPVTRHPKKGVLLTSSPSKLKQDCRSIPACTLLIQDLGTCLSCRACSNHRAELHQGCNPLPIASWTYLATKMTRPEGSTRSDMGKILPLVSLRVSTGLISETNLSGTINPAEYRLWMPTASGALHQNLATSSWCQNSEGQEATTLQRPFNPGKLAWKTNCKTRFARQRSLEPGFLTATSSEKFEESQRLARKSSCWNCNCRRCWQVYRTPERRPRMQSGI